MATTASERLLAVIKDTIPKIQKWKDRSLGEQGTKAALIEPILEALGWDVRDPDEVHREYKPTTRDCPVDYALKLLRESKLFVEAKGLGETLEDRRWVTQVLGYAVVAGVEWCVLTDGDSYRIYNAVATLDADEKLFCKIRLSDGNNEDAARTLALISRANMHDNILEALWKAHYVDRQVKEALRGMYTSADKSLVRLIRRKTMRLTPKEIIDSIRRLDIRIESPTIAEAALSPRSTTATQAKGDRPVKGSKGPKAPRKLRTDFQVKLADVVAAGLLKPPVALFRKYKGKRMDAMLLADGRVDFQGTVYKTGSTAAEVARGTVTGRKMNTNGWSFWQYLGADGKARELTAVRTEYLATKQTKAAIRHPTTPS